MMGKIDRVWNFIRRHKYAITVLIFGVLIGVVDENSLWKRYQHRREIATLHSEIDRYNRMIKIDTEKLNKLASTPGYMEDIARERYFMKKPNEDIFVFENKDTLENEATQ
jgi:cell division protein DivIC